MYICTLYTNQENSLFSMHLLSHTREKLGKACMHTAFSISYTTAAKKLYCYISPIDPEQVVYSFTENAMYMYDVWCDAVHVVVQINRAREGRRQKTVRTREGPHHAFESATQREVKFTERPDLGLAYTPARSINITYMYMYKYYSPKGKKTEKEREAR